MDDARLAFFRQQLEEMREKLLADATETVAELGSQTGNIPDPNDRASMESDRSFELRIRGRERKLLEKIDEALARILDGSYGVCESCGCDIDEKRLLARPVASFCIDCKAKQEKQEKSRGA